MRKGRKKSSRRAKERTSPTGQRCVLIVSLRGVRLSKHVYRLFDSLQDLTVAKNYREMRFLKRRNGRMDGPTDRPSYRDARTHLRIKTHYSVGITTFLFCSALPRKQFGLIFGKSKI